MFCNRGRRRDDPATVGFTIANFFVVVFEALAVSVAAELFMVAAAFFAAFVAVEVAVAVFVEVAIAIAVAVAVAVSRFVVADVFAVVFLALAPLGDGRSNATPGAHT